uniref:Serine hydrolase domain-containing protein n=2 Tax=Pyramimonas obovata TaxID=1411642 RepID=A0A7S0R2A9_9CHLO|mmetsp:Transcript_24042/g.52462  ORF Transcript_24042/g.52462 Transcript_24042/m.52462 type:complete len:226 (+) Transcript_24042:77-754(+)
MVLFQTRPQQIFSRTSAQLLSQDRFASCSRNSLSRVRKTKALVFATNRHQAPLSTGAVETTMPKEKLRILCLHGFRTSGRILQTLFRRSNFEQVFEDHAELVFVNAPYQCNEEEQSRIPAVLQTMFPGPYHEWWNAQEDLTYLRWEASAEYLRRYMCEHGPFDGVLGFSQGGSMASVVHLLQQEVSRQRTRPRDRVRVREGSFGPRRFRASGFRLPCSRRGQPTE